MSTPGPLPPHLEAFIREQLASGRFRSADEVIRTALHLLEGQVHADPDARAWLKREIERGARSKPAAPITPAFWDDLRDRVRAARPGDDR